jgi:peptidoglycan hydrolase-like protein with peptidoglycan-binding domain
MSKKNLLADQLNAFSEGLKNTTPIKITPKVEIVESETIEEVSKIPNPITPKINKKKNKFKAGETVQMSIIIPKTLQKELKALSFKTEKKVNTIIVEAIEKDLSELLG